MSDQGLGQNKMGFVGIFPLDLLTAISMAGSRYSNIDTGGLVCRVRLGSKGDIAGAFGRVRFTPESEHLTNELACRLSAQADITTSPNDDLATAADLA